MPIISQLAAGERGMSDRDGEGREFDWIVSTAAGNDPRTEIGVPAIGSVYGPAPALELDAIELVEFHKREAGMDFWTIRMLYSSDRRFTTLRPDRTLPEFRMSFGREVIEVPTFVLQERLAALANGAGSRRTDEWALEILNVEITVMVLERAVTVPPLTFDQVLTIRNEVSALHTFPVGVNDPWSGEAFLWRCEPPTITQLNPTQYRIVYAWTNDPGNGPFAEDQGNVEGFIAPHFSRKPFHKYRVIPTKRVSGDGVYPPTFSIPAITQYNAYPPNSPRRRPSGFLNLPGGPLG